MEKRLSWGNYAQYTCTKKKKIKEYDPFENKINDGIFTLDYNNRSKNTNQLEKFNHQGVESPPY